MSEHDVESPAPGELEVVRLFVNTRDEEEGTELLDSTSGLRKWLAEHGLLKAGTSVKEPDRQAAIEVREALRSLLLTNNGVPVDADAVERLRRASREARLGLEFTDEGDTTVRPRAEGVTGALGELLARVHRARAEGSWERLKACPADDCLWAFYDRSRNRSRRWCEMEVCGNRSKVRSYRERRSAAPSA